MEPNKSGGPDLDDEIEEFGDPGIQSKNAKIPLFLKLTVLILPFWGIYTFYTYWNGSVGWLDRGYWRQLQIAANTTFPIHNENMPGDKNIILTPLQENKVQKDLE